MSLAYVNGTFCKPEDAVVPALDRGFIFGDGLYEVVSYHRGKLLLLQEHLERYENGVREIMLKGAPSATALSELFQEIVARSKLPEGIVYMQVTRGTAPRTHCFPASYRVTVFMFTAPLSGRTEDEKRNGVKTILLPDDRWAHCNIKSVNLLPNCLALEKARQNGAYEAILVHPQKGVTECSSSNLFAVINNVLYTAPNGPRILPGITRNTLVKLIRATNIPLEERFLSREELLKADEVFLTNTTSGVLPIKQIDEVYFSVPAYRLTTTLHDMLEEHIKKILA